MLNASFSLSKTGAVVTLTLWTAAALAQVPLPPPYNYDEPLKAAPQPLPAWQYLKLGSGPQTYRMPVYANRTLDQGLQKIQRVIIVLPSTRDHTGQHYQIVADLVAKDPARKADTLVISPEFPTTIDPNFAGMPAWRRSSWETGNNSVSASGRPAPISAFTVMDDIVRRFVRNKAMPEVSTITLAAHGDSAQLLQRYAVLNALDGDVRRDGIALKYVIANAPSYLYLTNERPRRNGAGFAPYERGICPNYNQYPYGPQPIPEYAGDAAPANLYVRYASRDVVYLLGNADSNPEDQGLDQSCGAEAQGATRLSRGTGYVNYDQWLAKRGPKNTRLTHTAQRVMDVGHDAMAMFGSQCGSQALLGSNSRQGDKAATCQAITLKPSVD